MLIEQALCGVEDPRRRWRHTRLRDGRHVDSFRIYTESIPTGMVTWGHERETVRMTAASSMALVVLWSSGFIGAELGTRQAPASTLLAWRYLIAAAILIALCVWRHERVGSAGVRRQVVLGMPVSGDLPRADGERCGARRAVRDGGADRSAATARGDRAGCARACRARPGRTTARPGFGTRWCRARGQWRPDGRRRPVVGVRHAFRRMLSLAAGTVLQQRWRPPESVLVSMAVQSAAAAVVFWLLALAEGTAGEPTPPAFWGAVAWVVVLSSFGGYGTYLYVSRTQGATRGQHPALPDSPDHDAVGRRDVRRPRAASRSGRPGAVGDRCGHRLAKHARWGIRATVRWIIHHPVR